MSKRLELLLQFGELANGKTRRFQVSVQSPAAPGNNMPSLRLAPTHGIMEARKKVIRVDLLEHALL